MNFHTDPAHFRNFMMKHSSVKYVRLHWVDLSGVLRTRFVPKDRATALSSGRDVFTLAQNCMIMPIAASPWEYAPGCERWELHPDWSSLQICGFSETQASVMCFISHNDIQNVFAKCPRTLLSNNLKELEYLTSNRVYIGFEIEFTVLSGDLQPCSFPNRLGSYSTTVGLRGQIGVLLEKTLDALRLSDIRVHGFHIDSPDQLEISLVPNSPLKAIDDLVRAQEVIRHVFEEHGIRVSTHSAPTLDGAHNGCHMHFSLSPEGVHESFIQGVLKNLGPLCAIGMPHYDSYKRVMTHGTGTYIGWGTENRDLPIRKIGKGPEARWEFRMLDFTANPYLFMAILLAAGIDGFRNLEQLAWDDCKVNPSEVTGEDRLGYGVVDEMPSSLDESLDRLRESKSLRDFMGSELFSQYVKLKEKELKYSSEMSDEVRRQRFLEFF